jgi:hypothetical protein
MNCRECNKELENPASKFCNSVCKNRWVSKHRSRANVGKKLLSTCFKCGTKIEASIFSLNKTTCSKCKASKIRSKYLKLKEENKHKGYTGKCEVCGKNFSISKTQGFGRFCSRTCANSFSGKSATGKLKSSPCVDCGKNLTIKARAGIKNSRCEECKNRWRSSKRVHSPRVAVCKVCNKEFTYVSNYVRHSCSNKCSGRLAGLKSVQVQAETRRSKNETLFAEMCSEHFKHVETNKPMFEGWDADVVVHDVKIAVLWNGIWHYVKVRRNVYLDQIESREKIRIDCIRRAGYEPYIIKDMGKYDPKFVKSKFDEFIGHLGL